MGWKVAHRVESGRRRPELKRQNTISSLGSDEKAGIAWVCRGAAAGAPGTHAGRSHEQDEVPLPGGRLACGELTSYVHLCPF